jgi:asparagine synthase (glutamine-hydrolysing)
LLQAAPGVNHLAERLTTVADAVTPDRFAVAVRCFLTDREKQRLFLRDTRDFNTVEAVHRLYVGEDTHFTDLVEAVTYIDLMNYVGNHHVYRVDRFTMRFSLECRLPMLDHDLVAAACRIPSCLKISKGQRKYVLRRVAEKKIHPACLQMRKKGFDLPTDAWMRAPLAALVKQKLDALASRDLFDPREIRRIHAQWCNRFRTFRSVWQLVATEIWLEKFIDARG